MTARPTHLVFVPGLACTEDLFAKQIASLRGEIAISVADHARMRMLVENADDQTAADPSLLKIIARAHAIQARLIHNNKLTMHDIAREEQVSAAYIYSLLRLPWLAPDITTAIINGRKPPQLTAQTLMRLTPRSPDVSCSAREKSQPRNGAGEIFMTAAAEIARATVSAANYIERETGNPRKFARK